MKIGVFDSGLGGLTVLKELIKDYPNNEYIYFGDTLNLPYGTKTVLELEKRADAIINFLKSENVDLVIIACGTISSNIYSKIKDKYGIKIYDVLLPTIKYIKDNKLKNIGVLATSMTIKSAFFKNYVDYEVACPKLVPLIENGKINTPECEKAVKDYLTDLKKCDHIILGCTHYPLLSKIIKKYSNANLINMGKCVSANLKISNDGNAKVTLYFSLVNDKLKINVNNILEKNYPVIEKVL